MHEKFNFSPPFWLFINVEELICPRCGNNNPSFFGRRKDGTFYCRKCVGFEGEEAQRIPLKPSNVNLKLDYRLSREQQILSDKAIANFKSGIDTLVYAVCGSGKTEISFGLIAYAMSKGMNVGFALPRRDVVIELFYRLQDAFPHNKVVAVYGGHNDDLNGDLIILTTHQLYRYPDYFDLLVMDEIDAFPFKGNETLINIYRKSLRGHCLMMSATPSEAIKKEFSQEGHAILTLHTRFHKQPIPVPEAVVRFGFLKYFYLIKKLKRYGKEKKPCLIFVPTIAMAKSVFFIISLFVKGGNYVSSKRSKRPEIIADFKKGKYAYLVTTAVLERGVTIKGVQVIIFDADNTIYDSAALIQIAGRVGRKKDAADGEVIFLCDKVSKEMELAIKEIKHCNTYL